MNSLFSAVLIHDSTRRFGKRRSILALMEIDFGRTAESDRFHENRPKYFPFLQHLMSVSNLVFGGSYTPRDRVEDLAFDLGHTCREDYCDIAFLSAHGHENAATKLLRGLYERALAIDYMITEPAKAERFVMYAAIQEHRNMQAALRVVSEDAFDAAMAPKTSAAHIREFYQRFKGDFQETACKKCKTKRIQRSWDIDITAMADKVGEPYRTLFLLAYTIPTTIIHATLASGSNATEQPQRPQENHITLIVATEIFLQVLRSQNGLFSLGLEAELESCTKEFHEVWPELDSTVPESCHKN